MRIFQLLSDSDIEQLLAALSKAQWRDGGETAHGAAKERKKNQQITELDPVMGPAFAQLKQFIAKQEALRYSAFIRQVLNVRAAKYGEGDGYGWHVDLAIMDGFRSDISFTIFLNGKDEYDGGELEFDYGTHQLKVKGDKGQMIFYPTGLLHQVRPVTKGERLVIVGWIESLIPNAEDRENLYTLFQQVSTLKSRTPEGGSEFDKLDWALQYLVRRFANH